MNWFVNTDNFVHTEISATEMKGACELGSLCVCVYGIDVQQ